MTTTLRLLAARWHDAEDLAFVRACLRGDDEARDTWCRWIGTACGGFDTPSDARDAGATAGAVDARSRGSGERGAWLDPATAAGRRTKAFAPLAIAALERHGLDPGHQARATLRAWRLHEQLRLDQYREILRRALRAMADVDAPSGASMGASPPILLKGLALADTVYPQPLLRHCHDIDLVVAPDAQPRVAAALEARGFARRERAAPAADGSMTLSDASGLPIVVHTAAGVRGGAGARLMPSYLIPFRAAATATQRLTIDGQPVAVLDRAHALVHVCLGGLRRHRGPASLRWMFDAWHLMKAAAAPDARPDAAPALSWDRVVACVREHRLGLPVAAAMLLLSRRLGAEIPREQLDALIAEGARSGAAEQARVVGSFLASSAATYVRRRPAAMPPASPVSSGAAPPQRSAKGPTDPDATSG